MCSNTEQRLEWTVQKCCCTKSVIGEVLLVIARKQHSEIPDLNHRQRLSVYHILVRSAGNLLKHLENKQTRIKTPSPFNSVGWRQGGTVIRQAVLQVAGSTSVSGDSEHLRYPWTNPCLHTYIHTLCSGSNRLHFGKEERKKVGKGIGGEDRRRNEGEENNR